MQKSAQPSQIEQEKKSAEEQVPDNEDAFIAERTESPPALLQQVVNSDISKTSLSETLSFVDIYRLLKIQVRRLLKLLHQNPQLMSSRMNNSRMLPKLLK